MLKVHSVKSDNTTYLQSIGHVEGIPAKDLKVGDITVWNNGGTEKILSIVYSKTKKTMKCLVEYEWLDSVYQSERKLKSDRIVVIK